MKRKKIITIAIITIVAIVFIYYITKKIMYPSKPFNTNALGYKQNNPGNIRKHDDIKWSGEVPSSNAFEAFQTMAYGYRALSILLYNYIVKKRLNTIRQIITVYAPPSENGTENYIYFVAKSVGINPDQAISINDFLSITGEPLVKKIVRAISEKEVGGYDGPAIEQGYKMMLKDKFSL